MVNGFRDLSARVEPPPGAGGVVRLAARRARVRRPERAARRAGDHLDGPPGRPAVPGRRGADRARTSGTRARAATSTARTSPPRSPGSRASGPTRTRAPTATSSPGPTWCGSPATPTPSTARTPRRRWRSIPTRGTWDDRLLAAFGIDPARLPPVVGADEPVGEITAAFAADTGLPPATTSCAAAATRWPRRSAPGWSSRAPSVTSSGRPSRCAPSSDRPLRDRTQIAECHPHAAPGRWLLENPGWASAPRTAGFATSSAAGSTTRA